MNDQINLSNIQVNNFKSVWLELLKKKISIIYDISTHKNVDFINLLKEFIPEAFDHKSEWEDLYIIKENTYKTINNEKKNKKEILKNKKKKLILKKTVKKKLTLKR